MSTAEICGWRDAEKLGLSFDHMTLKWLAVNLKSNLRSGVIQEQCINKSIFN
jgi:hypothetical protein